MFPMCVGAVDWVRKGSYLTAWSVPGVSSCSSSYQYGHGTAIGPQTGARCWPLLAGVWRAIAPLMKPWCAEGEVPTAANLNLHRGWSSCGLATAIMSRCLGVWGREAHFFGELRYPGALHMEGQVLF